MFLEESITGSKEFTVSESREEVKVYTDADVTIAFWSVKLNSWGPEIDIVAPGDFVAVLSANARITGTARVVVC